MGSGSCKLREIGSYLAFCHRGLEPTASPEQGDTCQYHECLDIDLGQEASIFMGSRGRTMNPQNNFGSKLQDAPILVKRTSIYL